MTKERFKMIVAVYLILQKGDSVLLSKRKNTGYMDGMYSLPAGHVDGNETLTQALIRESSEEIGIDISLQNVQFVHVVHSAKLDETGERLDFYFNVTNWQNDPTNKEPEKCDVLTWFKFDSLPENIIPKIKLALQNYTIKKYYSDYS